MRENPYSAFRFVREWQYAWTEYLAYMQAVLVGGAEIRIAKAGVWDFIQSLPQRFLGRLAKRPSPPSIHLDVVGLSGPSYEEADREAHRWLHDNWNEVYQGENYKGTVLGMIAKEMLTEGVDLNVLKGMSLSDLDLEMQDKGYDGIDHVDQYLEKSGWKKSQYYAYLWAKSKGAEWLAVYDENGERAGRAYEVVTSMYRDVIARAIADNVPPDKIRQRLVFANDALVKREFMKDGKIDGEAYQAFVDLHLNRDMVRFAVTETSYAFNNGKLMQSLYEGAEYVRFMH